MGKRTKKLVEYAENHFSEVKLVNGVYSFIDPNGIEYTFKKGEKARFFAFVLYEDSAIENWRDKVADIIEWPFAYCTHNKDKILSDDGLEIVGDRKIHTHFIIALTGGTTTYNAILNVVNRLGKVSYLKVIHNVKGNYDYLIHDTKKAREDHKHVYDVSERYESADFDIGAYIQMSEAEVTDIKKQLTFDIMNRKILDYAEFILYAISMDQENECEDKYFKIATNNQNYFNAIIKGKYHQFERREQRKNEENEDAD